MKAIPRIKRHILKKILGIFSFTTALFVFQACYGTPYDLGHEILLKGTIKSATTKAAIPNIKIVINGDDDAPEITNDDGAFTAPGYYFDSIIVKAMDIDSNTNGSYQAKDTVIFFEPEQYIIDFELELTPVE